MPCPRSTRVKLMGVAKGRSRSKMHGPLDSLKSRGARREMRYLVSGLAAPSPPASVTTVPFLLVQAFSDLAIVQPLPLQPFWPLQSLSAPLQAPLPLQALMPAHFTPL